jgi:endonuclease YncB( thermonuclease family)
MPADSKAPASRDSTATIRSGATAMLGMRSESPKKETPGPLNRRRLRKGSRGQREQRAATLTARQTVSHSAHRLLGSNRDVNVTFVQHLLIMLLMALILPKTSAGNVAERPTFTGRVVGVHDGDTITVLTSESVQIKIRLEGIDAPELEQPYGQKAKAALSKIAFGKKVAIIDHGKDRYKRTLGRIICGKTDVNLEMVHRGIAWRYEKYSQEPALIEAQSLAKTMGNGLWAGDEPVPPSKWRGQITSKSSGGLKSLHQLRNQFTARSLARREVAAGFSMPQAVCVRQK